MMYDIGIIGGGTAGLTAAIYGQRAGKRTLVIEGGAFGGQITTSPKVENYPGIASVSGSEFSMNLLDQAMKLGTEPVRERVTGILEEDGIKIIVTTEREYPCKSIILATGVTHRHLGVPGEERLTGAGVSYCATCDGAFFRGKDVAVIGGGNSALDDALLLSEICNKVYLIHRRAEFRGDASTLAKLEQKENVEIIRNAKVQEITGNGKVEILLLDTGTALNIQGVFVAIGMIPQTEAVKNLVALDESGYIKAGEDGVTSVPGFFVAGDVRTKELRQIITAAADGANAANSAIQYIIRK